MANKLKYDAFMIDPHNFINSENVHSIICDKMGLIDSFFFPNHTPLGLTKTAVDLGGSVQFAI